MKQIVVFGLGKFGSKVAKSLQEKGVDVIAVDKNKQRVEEIKDFVTQAVCFDATDKESLSALGLEDIDAAIVAIGDNVEANLLITMLLKKMGVKKIYARVINPLQEEILKQVGVTRVINVEEEVGQMLANSLASKEMEKFIPLSAGHVLIEAKVPKNYVNKTIKEIDPRRKFKINIIAIKRKKPSIREDGQIGFDEEIIDIPLPDTKLQSQDVLLIIGGEKNIREFLSQ